jgi:tRNA pseudouridine synthase 10
VSAGRLAEVLTTAREILAAGPICDSCLGSAFGRLGHGLANEDRARAVRFLLELDGIQGVPGRCWVCQDVSADAAAWAERARAQVEGFEFRTYLFAVRPTLRWQEAEALLVERFRLTHAEPQKHAWNRTVGKTFETLAGHGTVNFDDPDVKLTIDLEAGAVECQVASLFVYGRYRKLLRGIPQTHWPCRRCRGRGCDACGGTGKQYAESVEELVAGPFVRASGGSGAILHGAGREDIDARMLGTGRPFVLEVTEPRVRTLDVGALEREANREAGGKVEASGLRWVRRDAVRWVKETPAEKTYRAVVEFGSPVSPEALADALRALIGVIEQRTPRRVAHRRADLVRTRVLHSASGILLDARRAEIELHTDGGLYVKELVSGDEGRTEPNLAGRLETTARVSELDVLGISGPDFIAVDEDSAMDSRTGVP